jgi:hypothetical protein
MTAGTSLVGRNSTVEETAVEEPNVENSTTQTEKKVRPASRPHRPPPLHTQ